MMPQASGYVQPQPAYAAQPTGFSQPGYAPRQPVQQPPMRNTAAAIQQPMPYYPQQQPYTAQPLPQEYAVRPAARRNDRWLQILLLAVLPVLFLLTLLISTSFLKIVFVGLGITALIAMWMQRSFVPSARATLTLVYGALILVSVVSLMTGNTPKDAQTSARGGSTGTQNQQPSNTNQVQGSMVQMGQDNNTATTPAPTPTIAPDSGENSAAWQRLFQFFSLWNTNKVNEMLDLVSPTWKAAQADPRTALFLITANRIPNDYMFEKISNSEADSTRTITMTATIDRRNNRDPVKFRFQVVMLKDKNEWYVDPSSLASNETVDDTKANGEEGGDVDNTEATATPKPESTPAPKTKLYYNSDGGKYYHADAECSKVGKEFLPLDDFYYRDLNTTKFKLLQPCPFCDAPERP